MYIGVEIKLHEYLSSALDGNMWLASHLAPFSPEEGIPEPAGWEAVWAQVRTGRSGKEKNLH
jgi:hypothetical protein